MRRLRNNYVGIDRGERVLFSDFEDGGPMWSGTGPRVKSIPITFEESFKFEPVVQVSITMWDMDNGTNARMDIQAEQVTEAGFDLVFRTWGDTKVARVRASWIAMGEIRHADDWDLY